MPGITKGKDTELIEKCLAGERDAQYILYHKYSWAMLNTAFRIINDADEAQDILQESFIKVFEKLDQFNYNSTPGAWIKKIVVNTAINHLRKKKNLEFREDIGQDIFDLTSDNDNWDMQMDILIAKKALALLPEGYRTVLCLYLIEGYDHSEIAEILGINISTSLSQFNRGKKRLIENVKMLKENGPDQKIFRRA